MSDFLTYDPPPAPKDTTKRVRFRTGLVLGEEEFQQDQAYFLERDRRHQRTLHGYGTVCGLSVELRDVSDGPEVLVRPGMAVNPAGETVLVPTAQCASLNSWLRSHRAGIDGLFGSPPASLTLDIQLCYRHCETDPKPVPGGPCRTQDELMQPSRTQDDFELRLEVVDPTSPLLSPPSSPPAVLPPEHLAVRALGDLLASIVIDPVGPFASPSDLETWVREIVGEIASPPMVLSPPAPPRPSTIRLDSATAEATIRSAFLVWVTEVRPRLASGCALTPPEARCVSLGHLLLTLDASGQVPNSSAVALDETTRPLLLNTELLQAWSLAVMLGGRAGVETAAHRVLAAGMFEETGAPLGATYGGPSLTRRGATEEYDVTYPGYVAPAPGGRTMLLVRGVVAAGPVPGFISLGGFGPTSFRVLVQDVRGRPANRPFQLEIVEYST